MSNRGPVRVAIDQSVNLRTLRDLQMVGRIELVQVHDLEQPFRNVAPQGGAFVLDRSFLGGPDMLADEKFNEVARIVGIENVKDVHHLYAAYLNGCDYFVTEDVTDFIHEGRREKLETLLRVKIRRVQEFLAEIGGTRSASHPIGRLTPP